MRTEKVRVDVPRALPEGLSEELVTLSEARKFIPKGPGGKTRAPSTLWRWAKKGVRGVRLRTVKIGRVAMTTERWLWEFWTACANADRGAVAPHSGEPPTGEAPCRPRRRSRPDQVERELDRLGVIDPESGG